MRKYRAYLRNHPVVWGLIAILSIMAIIAASTWGEEGSGFILGWVLFVLVVFLVLSYINAQKMYKDL